MGYVGFEFITQSDRGEFAITIEMPAGYSLDETNFTALYIEQLLHDFPETERVFSSVGVSNMRDLLGKPLQMQQSLMLH